MIVGKRTVAEVTGRKNLLYDRDGEQHYNLISAFHKSMRNSDPDAAVYWLARMLAGGEDPLFIARRMIEFAGDDVGLADPDAQLIAVSCFDACRFMGMPDCRYALAETAVYLSLAPRSNSLAVSIDTALEDARRDLAEPVPMHLRNAPTELMEKVGYSKGYEYAEGTGEKVTRMQCLPDGKKGTRYYEPGTLGAEQQYRRRLNAIRDWKEGRRDEPPFRPRSSAATAAPAAMTATRSTVPRTISRSLSATNLENAAASPATGDAQRTATPASSIQCPMSGHTGSASEPAAMIYIPASAKMPIADATDVFRSFRGIPPVSAA